MLRLLVIAIAIWIAIGVSWLFGLLIELRIDHIEPESRQSPKFFVFVAIACTLCLYIFIGQIVAGA